MDLKKIDLNKLQDYAFRPDEIAIDIMCTCRFINIKCLDNESIIPTVQAIPLEKVKQAREEIENMGMGSYLEFMKEIACNDREVRMSKKFAIAILDKLIAEN